MTSKLLNSLLMLWLTYRNLWFNLLTVWYNCYQCFDSSLMSMYYCNNFIIVCYLQLHQPQTTLSDILAPEHNFPTQVFWVTRYFHSILHCSSSLFSLILRVYSILYPWLLLNLILIFLPGLGLGNCHSSEFLACFFLESIPLYCLHF